MTQTINGGTPAAPNGDIGKSIQDGLTKAITTPQKLFEAHMAASVELMSFVSRRMQAQAELLGLMTQCRDVEAAAAAQRTFFEKATGHYSEEMTHLMDIARKNLTALTDAAIEPPRATH